MRADGYLHRFLKGLSEPERARDAARRDVGPWIVAVVETITGARDVLGDEHYVYFVDVVGRWIDRERQRVSRRRRTLRVVP